MKTKHQLFRTSGLILITAILSHPCGAWAEPQRPALTQADVDRAWDAFEDALVKEESGDRDAAIQNIETGLSILPGNVRMHVLVASLLELQGRNTEALSHWRIVAQQANNPSDQAEASLAIARLTGDSGMLNVKALFYPPFDIPSFTPDDLAKRKKRFRQLIGRDDQEYVRFDKVESGVFADESSARESAARAFSRYEKLASYFSVHLSIERDYVMRDLGTHCLQLKLPQPGWKCKTVFQHVMFKDSAEQLPASFSALNDEDPMVREVARKAKKRILSLWKK